MTNDGGQQTRNNASIWGCGTKGVVLGVMVGFTVWAVGAVATDLAKSDRSSGPTTFRPARQAMRPARLRLAQAPPTVAPSTARPLQ